MVGYTSIAFYEKSSNSLKSEKVLSEEDEKAALDIARKTLQSYFENGIIPEIVGPNPGLLKKLGAFVTLKKDGKLRGCIGHIEADTPLFQLISKMAISSAIHDPRFSPVQGDELNDIKIEISVLSPPVRVKSIEEITIGRDGLIIRKGSSSGLLLPQVPVEWGWDRPQFLKQICRKAGIAEDAWKTGELYRFTAQVFSEK